jgi:hypothetical protein
MALSRVKTWKRNEVLLSTDLNTEFDNIIENAGDATFPLETDLEVGSKLLINTGLQNPLQWHDGAHCIEGKYSSSLPVAINSIGTSRITLVIGSSITIGADLTIPDNVLLWFVGPGRIFKNSGVTLTISSPAQILAGTNQQVFDGTGTVSFSTSGIISPGWWGFSTSATAAQNADRFQEAVNSLPATTGGAVVIPPGTYSMDDSITFGSKAISVIGSHPEMCLLSNTADASEKHGFIFTRSHHVRNITLKTSANLTQNRSMFAIRMNLDGVTVSGGNQATVYEHVKVRGYNGGIYNDGGDAYNIDRAYLKDIDIQVSGDGAVATGICCLNLNRINQILAHLIQADQNGCGEHALYFFGSKQITLDTAKITGASNTESQAIKFVGNGVAPDDDQAYGTWAIRNVQMTTCTNGIVCSTYGTETLDALFFQNITADGIDSTNDIPAIVMVSAADTAEIRSVKLDTATLRNIGRQGLHVSAGATATIGTVEFANVNAYNWSTTSAGTYTLFGTNGAGTYKHIHLRNIEADGNSNGRTIVGSAGMSTSVSRVTWEHLHEVDTTGQEWPITDSGTGATFNFAVGNTWKVSGSRSVTAASNAVVDQTYTIIGTNNNFTLTDNSTFKLNGNWVSAADKSITLKCIDATPTFIELARSAN